MVDQGVYPDPDYGLNNLAIPESLNKQDYWYRTEFAAPNEWKGRHVTLTFEGINYAASVWLNAKQLGTIKGAFVRGVFDVTGAIKLGQTNVLAVRVSPPPHPGIPHEQSIKAGAGENGGIMCLDGPTFVDTEGWDWIPAIRDRDTGIWQPVTLRVTSGVRIGDPQIVTKLPLPATNQASVDISVPLINDSAATVRGTLTASFENVAVSKIVSLSPGKNEVKLSPAEFSQLSVQNPHLWWPNGYGKPELYTLKLSFSEAGKDSDAKDVRFGIREITYELSLLDSTGHLRRVDYSPTVAREKNEQVVDVTHEGIRNIPNTDPYPSIFPPEWKEGWKSWVASLKPGAEKSAAVKAVDDTRASPYLTIRVNGVRIAARGGSWGMDDSRKRVSREKLEPYFRLHRDANVNIIRNWVGQSTEETFYDLADEYGLLVWNDFWASTQNYNVEPEDPELFLENARDTISAISQSSFNCDLVWPQRRCPTAHLERRPGSTYPHARWHALLHPHLKSGESAKQRPLPIRRSQALFHDAQPRFFCRDRHAFVPHSRNVARLDSRAGSLAHQRCVVVSRLAHEREWRDGSIPHGIGKGVRRRHQPGRFRSQSADAQLRAASRHIRRHERASLGTKHRPHVVDDAARVAQLHLANLQLRLRHAGFLLRRQKSQRAFARATRSNQFPGASGQFSSRRCRKPVDSCPQSTHWTTTCSSNTKKRRMRQPASPKHSTWTSRRSLKAMSSS